MEKGLKRFGGTMSKILTKCPDSSLRISGPPTLGLNMSQTRRFADATTSAMRVRGTREFHKKWRNTYSYLCAKERPESLDEYNRNKVY
ncbi:hypothetical protein CC1G_02528 [Coprinopsis cinerea okayama7|uniref:Uncharacterized protein n=1 Tax=Coprinopsis cinerea (strain Okayama-7 / 130 / ATCC MYA-4618 / FGSC 9003) TaxID=240176 RepID=A8NBR8_COPC7|nr:hypothetical protein CC1G_02528 [Coprinopsis cinerea okayama7\|eukprot:XP_001832266.2 hypothetical protein CC1G_02528 [Coprinopsis cinerea okayama7\